MVTIFQLGSIHNLHFAILSFLSDKSNLFLLYFVYYFMSYSLWRQGYVNLLVYTYFFWCGGFLFVSFLTLRGHFFLPLQRLSDLSSLNQSDNFFFYLFLSVKLGWFLALPSRQFPHFKYEMVIPSAVQN